MIKQVTRKSMEIRYSGRSTDYISPSFGYGCLLNCSYCYMKRHSSKGVTIAGNHETILHEIDRHAMFYADAKKPNQTHEFFTSYDISCNEDFALHAKFHDWPRIFEFFRDHDSAMGSFATKIVPTKFLEFNPEGKIRIRFSLMPQRMSSIVEPNTAPIADRIAAIDEFIAAGYDVHVNFSPIILYQGWKEDYIDLFQQLDAGVSDNNKEIVKAECIMLTHEENKHNFNVENNIPGEEYLWNPTLQEPKTSQYGGSNVRYKRPLKRDAISQFKQMMHAEIPWCTIRYIF
jgi:spore photoproduct lyase